MLPAADAVDAVERALAANRGRAGALLPVLHAIQDELGFVPPLSLAIVADALNLSHSDVHGVVTFYHDFRQEPPGRHVIKLCRAEACQAVGCEALGKDLSALLQCGIGETRSDGAVTVEPVYCLGNCALGPSALVNGELRGRVTAHSLRVELADLGAFREAGKVETAREAGRLGKGSGA